MSQPGLVRQLGTLSATALVVSNMIGGGIFTTTGFLAGDLGQPSFVIGIWLVGAALALAGGLCYSELGANFPRSGGEYVYLSEAWGPAWGFIDGWASFFAGSTICHFTVRWSLKTMASKSMAEVRRSRFFRAMSRAASRSP